MNTKREFAVEDWMDRYINANLLKYKIWCAERTPGYVQVVDVADIDAVPTADVELIVEAKWEHSGSVQVCPCSVRIFTCSKCGYEVCERTKRCPDCGAHMQVEA